jgi:hypothetical protein
LGLVDQCETGQFQCGWIGRLEAIGFRVNVGPLPQQE